MPRLPEFQTTLWSVIARAQVDSVDAVNRLLSQYRAPVFQYLLAQGLQPADAEDLTQEVFCRLHQEEMLKRADREKGRFRWLLLGIARNVLREHHRNRRTLKRGAGKVPVSLDRQDEAGPALADVLSAPAADEQFDRIWVTNLVEQALRAAQEEERKSGRSYLELLQLRTAQEWTYEQIAERHQLQLHDVKNYLRRARKHLAAEVWRLVEGYSSTLAEYEEEVAFISRLLGEERKKKGDDRPSAGPNV